MRRFPIVLLCLVPLACTTPSAQAPKLPPLPPRPATRPLTGKDAAMVKEVVAKVVQVRHLSFLHPVEAREGGKDIVTWLVHRDLRRDKLKGRFQTDRAMLIAFGFITPKVDLEKLLTGVMDEQVRGLYDSSDKTLLVIPGPPDPKSTMPASMAKAGVTDVKVFLLHELVHALQDQHWNLERLTNADVTEDTSEADHSLVEGDATYAMFDYMLEATSGLHVWQLPNLGMMKTAVAASIDDPKDKALNTAPLYLRQTLLSSYIDGMLFVDALYRDGGWAKVDSAYTHPPTTTEQILHPEKYLSGEGPVKVSLPKLGSLEGDGWARVTSGRLGELGVDIFVAGLAGKKSADDVAAGWGGDHYRVYRHAGRLPAVVWLVDFDDANAAARVAAAITPSLAAHPEVAMKQVSKKRLAITVHLAKPVSAKVLARLAGRP